MPENPVPIALQPELAPSASVALHLEAIHARLARIEDMIVKYQPMLEEAARRMQGPTFWTRRTR